MARVIDASAMYCNITIQNSDFNSPMEVEVMVYTETDHGNRVLRRCFMTTCVGLCAEVTPSRPLLPPLLRRVCHRSKSRRIPLSFSTSSSDGPNCVTNSVQLLISVRICTFSLRISEGPDPLSSGPSPCSRGSGSTTPIGKYVK